MKETITEFVELACIIAVAIAATNAMKFIFAYIISLV
jgi:hypothetical protein